MAALSESTVHSARYVKISIRRRVSRLAGAIADQIPEIRHKRRITVAAASKILANLTYAYKGYGLSMGTMLAGVCSLCFMTTELQD